MKQVCNFCSGSGKTRKFPRGGNRTCVRCNGSGVVENVADMPDNERCPECYGHGGSVERCGGDNLIYECKKCGGTGKKGCFITTTVVNSLHKGDKCHELQVLREFRDSILLQNKNTRKLVHEYYKISPSISKKLENNYDDKFIKNIFNNYISPTVKHIENHDYDKAINTYKQMVEFLS